MEAERQEFLASRPRNPPNNAVTFLENQVQLRGEQPSVFIERLNRVDSLEVGKEQKKISDDLWKQADEAKATLFGLVEQVRMKLDKKGGTGGTSVPGQSATKVNLKECTWDQVMQEVQVTASHWSSSPNRDTKRKHLETIGRHSDAFNAWLQVLPGGDYGSSICGVFALAIGAASQYSKVEDAIVEALAQIPEIVEGARRYVTLYAESRDHRLEEKTFDLYLSILRTLCHIMRFFADSSIRRFCGPLFMQSSYQKGLLESIDNVKTRAARVETEAEHCFQKGVSDMRKTLQSYENILLGTYEGTKNGQHVLQSIYDLLKANGGRSLEPLPPPPRQSIQQQQLLLEQRQEERRQLEEKQKEQRHQQQRKLVDDLLDALQFDPDSVQQDLDKCLRLGVGLEGKAQARTASLIRNPVFEAYMTEHDFSSSLLVHGNDDLSVMEGQSPLSLVAARLAQLSAQPELSFGLSYFCAEHPVYRRIPSSIPPPVEMLCSLIGQLISQMQEKLDEIDLSFLGKDQWRKIRALNPKTLCSVFEELTHSVPKDSLIMCVVDEAWLYENGPSRQITLDIFRRLTRLVRKSKDVIFKLFVTCRGRSRMLQEYFAEHILNLNEFIEVEDSSTWTVTTL